MKLKKCNSCDELKSKDEFYSRRDSKDGLRHNCKACQVKYTNSMRHVETPAPAETPKVTGTCNRCHKPMYVNRFFHFECLEGTSYDSIPDDLVYS